MQTQSQQSPHMRAVRLYGPGLAPRMEALQVPRPRVGEALLRVLAGGVCHTELQLLDGTLDPGVWPLTPGHEIVGEVVAGTPELVGQRMLVYYSQPCGECQWCADGQEQVCPNAGPQPGLSADGGFAEFVSVATQCLVPLPDNLDSVESAPLGCAAATAYHALHGVAQLEAGQTMAVYGIGGVGLPLVQLGVACGARVLAVGRSPAKLALARDFGAEVVDAAACDPVLQLRRLTRGEGVHAVFDLVGSDQSLPQGIDMLRRQGCLVLVGYGAARLRINPLHMVLRETRVLSSLGNSRAELREVVRLAAAGALRVPVAARFALEEVGLAFEALRAGELAGRAVIVPALAASRVDTVERPASRRVDPLPPLPVPAKGGRTPADAALEVPATPRPDPPYAGLPLETELLAFVDRGLDVPRQDAEFNDLALRLFAYQFANNRAYRLLCERRGRTPSSVVHWREIPPVPIAAFKETLLAAEPIEGDTVVEFNSSGTTLPQRKSRHFYPSLKLYDRNATLNFAAHVLPDSAQLPLMVLFPARHELPHSSLAHWLSLMVEQFGARGSGFFVDNSAGLDAPRLLAALHAAAEPVGLLAVSFGLVHLLEHCQATGQRVVLPPGSRVMDTGGYKGRSREYAKKELYGLVTDLLGVPTTHIVNMYGMTEHGTQFLDAALRDALRKTVGPRFKVVPPWARTLVVDPETLAERPPGERGLLLHVDLINRASALAVLTEDVGHTVGDGFEVLGRAEGSEARGCSIALDELLSAIQDSRR